ncbi:hypothetical protein FMM75_22630 [Lachnospiraceae bacterium MD335]|nr:hypothetical protein [Lachnospiraceae bacterium MD335]
MIANIGKGVLYQLIGIQGNSKKVVLKVNGISKESPCSKCPWMKAAMANPDPDAGKKLLNEHCAGCSSRCFDLSDINLHTEYRYESYYGAKPRLNKNAVLLFMLLHLQTVDASGFISNVSVPSLAKTLHVHERSIKNNLKKLKASGYIHYDMGQQNTVNVILLDYKMYYAPAREGGVGYIKISDAIINELSNITSIVFFRILIRQYLESDQTEETTKTYKELLHSLPRYCRRSIINRKIEENQGIFNIFHNKDSLTFKLSPDYNAKNNYEKQYIENTKHYTKLLKQLDDFVFSTAKITPATHIPCELTRFFFHDGNLVSNPCLFQRSAMEEAPDILARLACKYGILIVDNALADTYRMQMCTKRKLIHNLGAFIRTVIKNDTLVTNTIPLPETLYAF